MDKYWDHRNEECPDEKQILGSTPPLLRTPEMADKARKAMLTLYGLEDLYFEEPKLTTEEVDIST